MKTDQKRKQGSNVSKLAGNQKQSQQDGHVQILLTKESFRSDINFKWLLSDVVEIEYISHGTKLIK